MNTQNLKYLSLLLSLTILCGLVLIQSCDRSLPQVSPPVISILGVSTYKANEVDSVDSIRIDVKDEVVVSKVHVFLISDDVVLLDTVFEPRSPDFTYNLVLDITLLTRDVKWYEIEIIAYNYETFNRSAERFGLFKAIRKAYLQLVWTENEVYTLDSAFNSISSQQFPYGIVDVAVTPQNLSYVLIDTLGTCELRDILSHEVIWQKQTNARAPKNSLVLTSENLIALSLFSEPWFESPLNKMIFMDNSGIQIHENSSAGISGSHYVNIVDSSIYYSLGKEGYYVKGGTKPRRIGGVSFISGNGNDEVFAIGFGAELFGISQYNGISWSSLITGNGLTKKNAIDFCATFKNLWLLNQDGLLGFDIESMQQVKLEETGSQLYANYFDGIPYIIFEKQILELNEDNLTTNEVYKASDMILGMETLHVHEI